MYDNLTLNFYGAEDDIELPTSTSECWDIGMDIRSGLGGAED